MRIGEGVHVRVRVCFFGEFVCERVFLHLYVIASE